MAQITRDAEDHQVAEGHLSIDASGGYVVFRCDLAVEVWNSGKFLYWHVTTYLNRFHHPYSHPLLHGTDGLIKCHLVRKTYSHR